MTHHHTLTSMAELELETHQRAISYKPGYKHACSCGWHGIGATKTQTLRWHQATKVMTALRTAETTPDHPGSTYEIEMHRAHRQPLCGACQTFLDHLK